MTVQPTITGKYAGERYPLIAVQASSGMAVIGARMLGFMGR
jgi:hypothetical protein